MTKLIELKAPKLRFARSINVERDGGSAALEGYIPVGRAIEVVHRLAQALAEPTGEVALSITGPYGSGKSSLALLLDSLLAGASDPERRLAGEILKAAAPEASEVVAQALRANDADVHGFIRATITAQREAVTVTVLRALLNGLDRYHAPTRQRQAISELRQQTADLLEATRNGSTVSIGIIRGLVKALTVIAPVLLLIDEFGKNLESFAESSGDGDLFLVQELAEMTRSTAGRFAIMTLQHMAFAEYANTASSVQRREWVKIQGRFEDVPFVDTAVQARALIAAAFHDAESELEVPLSVWAAEHHAALRTVQLNSLSDVREVQAAWPLHPVALLILPELCLRYGQNERTMFSFLASMEPRSVARFLSVTDFSAADRLPAVHLHQVYDYFIESASAMVGVSADASRWIEIDGRIRDINGLDDATRRVLKTVGLLNLVSTGGALRASRSIVEYAAADGLSGTEDRTSVASRLDDLAAMGVITYRDFADEFRVWHGSDFDLASAVAHAHRRLREEPIEALLQRVLPLPPVVAARHSYKCGTLRAFERRWVSARSRVLPHLTAEDKGDGLLAYVLGGDAPTELIPKLRAVKPVVLVTPKSDAGLVEIARELAALDEILATDDAIGDDWVVRKEVNERRVTTAQRLRSEFEKAFGAGRHMSWTWRRFSGEKTSKIVCDPGRAASAIASDVADHYYDRSLPLRNDLVNRHELSSQAAKARREVADVMASRGSIPALGIDGFGPDRTLYRSLFDAFALHREIDGEFRFSDPPRGSGAGPVWRALVDEIGAHTRTRLNVADLYADLALPPFGLRQGVAPLLLIAALLSHADVFALYEHGTYRSVPSGDVCERLLRNPRNFEVKSFAASTGPRLVFLKALAEALSSPDSPAPASTVVATVAKLVTKAQALNTYSRRTSSITDRASAVRHALLTATEPDVLLFRALPSAVGAREVDPDRLLPAGVARQMATEIVGLTRELEFAYEELMGVVRFSLVGALRPDTADVRGSLSRRATELKDKVLDPRLRGLVAALRAEGLEDDAWLEYVAMQVVGTPPGGWADEHARRFHATMQDLGASFLRIEALAADMRASGTDVAALRLAVTSSQGGEAVRLLAVDPERASSVHAVVEAAASAICETQSIDLEGAMDLLLSHLLERELARGGLGAAEPRAQPKESSVTKETA